MAGPMGRNCGAGRGRAVAGRFAAGFGRRNRGDADDRRVGAAAQCAGGIQISASHNPAQYNGLKLFSAEGRVVPANVGRKVLEQYDAGCWKFDTSHVQHPASGIGSELADTTSAHLRSSNGSSTWTEFVRGDFACCSMRTTGRAACWEAAAGTARLRGDVLGGNAGRAVRARAGADGRELVTVLANR